MLKVGVKESPEKTKKRVTAFKATMQTPEYRRKRRRLSQEMWDSLTPEARDARLSRAGKPARITKPERIVLDLVEKYALPLRYTGNLSFWIRSEGEKRGLNPDFVATDGSRRCVEVFGDYWHRIVRPDEETRRSRLMRAGWDALILWEHDICKNPPEQTLVEISMFLSSEGPNGGFQDHS